jgi:hypothetical protein
MVALNAVLLLLVVMVLVLVLDVHLKLSEPVRLVLLFLPLSDQYYA